MRSPPIVPGLSALSSPGLLLRAGLALGYALVMILLYQQLSYRWYYLGLQWANPTREALAAAILLPVFPAMLLPKRADNLHRFSAWILHYFVLTPAIAIPLLQGYQMQGPALRLVITITVCAMAFNGVTRIPSRALPELSTVRLKPNTIAAGCALLVLAGVAYMFATHGESLQLAGLDRVYEQRTEFSSDANAFDNYFVPFLANVLAPFLFVVGMERRKPWMIGVAIAGTLTAYSAFALKSVILSPIFIVAVYALFDRRRQLRIAVIPIFLIGITVLVAPFIADLSSGAGFVIASLVFVRTLILPGVIVGLFSAYFSIFELTYYSHSQIGRLFTTYPYGDLSVGQVVGLYIFPNQAEPFELNGSFVATDGLAALGLVGIPIAFLVATVFLRLLSDAVDRADKRVVFSAMMPFLVTLANTSIFSSMLTGGGFALGGLFYLYGLATAQRSESPLVFMPQEVRRA